MLGPGGAVGGKAPKYGRALQTVRRVPGVQYAYEHVKNRRRVPLVRSYLRGGVGAELGVHKGYFTAVLLKHGQPDALHIVDPWFLLGSEWEWAGGSRSTVRALSRIIRRFGPELVDRRLRLHIGDDLAFLRDLPERSLDWAYIDSTHEFEHTMAELRLLESRVRFPGVIAGDDWHDDTDHRHRGVADAVLAFCQESEFKVVHADSHTHQWAVRR